MLKLNIICGIILVYIILNCIPIKFKIFPYNINDGCRFSNITYVDDNEDKYVYAKTYLTTSSDENSIIDYQTIKKEQHNECFLFLLVFLMISIVVGYFFFVISDNFQESVLITFSILVFITFVPLNTLHATDSNIWKKQYFRDEDGRFFYFKAVKI